MEFRKSNEKDIDRVMNIVKQAQEYFKQQGIDQWQNNYPNIETIINDINNKNSYVLVKDNCIVATAAICFGKDKNYHTIYNGEWLSENEYASIHRIAVDFQYKGCGLGSHIIENIEVICLNNCLYSIRVDTHKDNKSMQKLLEKNEFKYCGIIYLEGKSERVAFEKLLQRSMDNV